MNLKLQKQHRLIWAVLAILLPFGFISAYLAIPSSALQTKTTQIALDNLEKTVENDLVTVNYYVTESANQLEVILKKALTTPSTVLFLSKDKTSIENAKLIGSLSNKNTYHFGIGNIENGQNLLFYDGIKKVVYQSLEL